MRLAATYAQDFLNLLLNFQSQPTDTTPGVPKITLGVAEVAVPNLAAEEITFNNYANEAYLSSGPVLLNTGTITPATADTILIYNNAGTVMAFGDMDAPTPIDTDANVQIPDNGIAGGIGPNADGATTQDIANTTAWGSLYYQRFFDHILNKNSWAGGPASLYLTMFATGTPGEVNTDPGLGVYTNRPVVPLAPEWTAEPRVQITGTSFDISNPSGNVQRGTLNKEIRFPNSSITTIASVGLYDALTGGNVVAMSDVNPDAISQDGNDVVFGPGSIWFEINTGA